VNFLEGILVKEVIKNSIAEEAGIKPGDRILSVDGEPFFDILEYNFLTSSECYEVKLIKEDGDYEIIEVINSYGEDLGIIFERPLIDKAKSCSNNCIFCFIDQLPKGLRKPLYFKDDDSRLSFLQGNYVTLTNMNDEDIKRLIRFKISPINISVHTTNKDLRVFMLRNKKAGKILNIMKQLSEANIKMNCQIVLCKNINDGVELDNSLNDMTKLYPYVNSISVVPAGITKYRKNLFPLESFNKLDAETIIKQVESWQKKLVVKYGTKIVFLADEFYLLSGQEIPTYSDYEDFPQIENGVGLLASMAHEFTECLNSLFSVDNIVNRDISIATGAAAYSTIKMFCEKICEKFSNVNINVYKITNEFFGENVTVAGLLTGKDIINQLSSRELGKILFLPKTILRNEGDLLLDNLKLSNIEKELSVKVVVVENNGYDFIYKILGLEGENHGKTYCSDSW
jgi:putative radical SAM enzyme (TIGR03279 family)